MYLILTLGIVFIVDSVLSAKYLYIAPTTTMGVARGAEPEDGTIGVRECIFLGMQKNFVQI